MPVSPQDFALWSRYTGRPYPQTPAERMSLAPEVYAFNRQLDRGQNPLAQVVEGVGSALDFAGRAALGTGLLVGAGLLAGKYLKTQQPTKTAATQSTPPSAAASSTAVPSPGPTPSSPGGTEVAISVPVTSERSVIRERRYPPSPDMPEATKPGTLEHLLAQARETQEGSPGMGPEQASMAELARQSRQYEAGEKLLRSETEVSDLDALLAGESQAFAQRYAAKLQLDDEPGVVLSVTQSAPHPASPLTQNIEATDHPSPGEINNPIVSNQTEVTQILRGTSPGKPTRTPIEDKPVTQTAVLATQQDSYPGTETEQLVKGAIQRGAPIPHTPIQDPTDAFRQTPQYSEMMRSAGASMEPEELVGAPGQPVSFTEVRATPATRVTGAEPVAKESAIAEMVTPKVSAPTPTPAPVVASVRRTPASDELERLSRMSGISPELLSRGATKTEAPEVIVTTQPVATRVAKEGKIVSNPYLSAMSQQQGPLAAYPVPEGRSENIQNVTFYPGGEIGVTMPTRGKGPIEYAYQATDPYRLAIRDYADEGYPSSMGSLGALLGSTGTGRRIGLKGMQPGGIATSTQPEYLGLMSQQEVAKKLQSRSAPTRQQAQQHAEAKEMLQQFSARYPQPPMSPEEQARLRAERTPAAVAAYRAGLSSVI